MTKHLFLTALVFSLVELSSHSAEAAGRATFTGIHQNYISIRAAGMGGAFAAVANDESAIFYNPAAFGRFREGKMQGTLIDGGMTASFTSFAADLQSAAAGGALALANFLQGQVGKNYYGRIKFMEMFWARPKWGIAFIPADISIDLKMDNSLYDDGNALTPDAPPVNLRLIGDTTFAASYGGTIKNETFGLLNVGVTAKAVLRQYWNRNIKTDDPDTNITDADKTDGLTTDLDFGILFTPYMPEGPAWNWLRVTRPTIGLVARNLLDGGFGNKILNKTSTFEPERLYRVYDIGFRFEIPKFWIFGGRFAIDQRDIGHPYYNSTRGLHTGLEFDWTVANWWKGQWRLGYGQGYTSLGFSAMMSLFRLDIATYGEDIGSLSQPVENRVYQVKMSGEF